MKKAQSRISLLAIFLLVVILFTTLGAAAANVDSNAKSMANLIEKQGVILDGKLGIQDQNKELANTQIGTVISILNWAKCVSVTGTEVTINPEQVLTASLPSEFVTDADIQLAYDVAKQIKKVAPSLKIKETQEIGLRSSGYGYEQIVSVDRSYNTTEVTAYTLNVALYPTTGSHSFTYTAGIAVSASAPIPKTIFTCSIEASTTYSVSFTHNWGPASQAGYVCWPVKTAHYLRHEHKWDNWYWYIDYPGGPKNYTYLGNDYSNSKELIQNQWGQDEGPAKS